MFITPINRILDRIILELESLPKAYSFVRANRTWLIFSKGVLLRFLEPCNN